MIFVFVLVHFSRLYQLKQEQDVVVVVVVVVVAIAIVSDYTLFSWSTVEPSRMIKDLCCC